MATFQTGWGPKPKGRLADYANASKGTLLLGDVQAHMIKEASKPSTRRQDIIHPSEMAKTGWCPRATLMRISACREASDPFLKPAESYGVQLLNIFDEGHYIHDKWQKRLRDMGDLWGNWYCTACGLTFTDEIRNGKCPGWKCQTNPNKMLEYREIPLHSDALLISGHADGGIPRLKALIEIKSVGTGTARIEAPDIFKANSDGQKIDLQGLWKDIKEPFPAHMRQGQLYLYIAAEMGLNFDQIIFLYESKFNQGAKEFVVKYDYSVVKPLIKQAQDIVSALDSGESIKCPYNGCKDCEIYGDKKPSITNGMELRADGISKESTGIAGIQGTETTNRGSTRTSKRLIRFAGP